MKTFAQIKLLLILIVVLVVVALLIIVTNDAVQKYSSSNDRANIPAGYEGPSGPPGGPGYRLPTSNPPGESSSDSIDGIPQQY